MLGYRIFKENFEIIVCLLSQTTNSNGDCIVQC